MSNDTELAVVQRELKLYGIKPEVERGSENHHRVSWQIPGKARRVITVAASGSDWRGPLNERAKVRRLLREDGIELGVARETNGNGHNHPKPEPTPILHQALSAPPVVTLQDQVIALRAETGDLTEVIAELVGRIGEMNTTLLDLASDVGEMKFMLKAAAPKPKRRGRPPGSKNKAKR